ncbi:CoA transferase [Bradyrhizobium sp. CIAT3101]|uniref:CaiB/BaiF CoA transferase family protein n=1 Tax=Bradyrhizobium sp. CIAT3101 TaxID=439387 RepID=UPI0024B12B0A|nr:CoA transferase [Bradyrhizobium sp. CIAT3101]WFU80497.1 CoA transferase [Bradyrhizobium sp. CIAT3101]
MVGDIRGHCIDRKEKQSPGGLSHLSVIDIGSSDASSYCARLFGGFGVDVQKIEPRLGDRMRPTAPVTLKDQSAWFVFRKFNRSITILDPAEAGAITRLTALIEDCDFLIDGRDVDFANCPFIDAGRPPLDGGRVVDFSMGWAGPSCTRIPADLGADVIKIEAIQNPDLGRGVDRRPAVIEDKMYEGAPCFCNMNLDKSGIRPDLTRPRGLALVERLLAKADIVVDDYPVDFLPKLGPRCDVLRALNPRSAKLSMSAFGADSIYRDCRTYGSTLERSSGLSGVVGKSDMSPVMSHVAFGDAIGSLNGCAAVLIALVCARYAGQGQLIDLAQIECMRPIAAPWFTIHSIDPMSPKRYGNRNPQLVPHGCFRCAGEDNWLIVAATDNEMWQRLAIFIGRRDWAVDASLNAGEARRCVEDNIENAIEASTRTRNADQVMFELQSVSVASGVARHPIDLLQEPPKVARISAASRAPCHRRASTAIDAERRRVGLYTIRAAAPTLGQHNSEILMGFSSSLIAMLQSRRERHRRNDNALREKLRKSVSSG